MYKAEKGQHGQGKKMHGRKGKDITIQVPPGTMAMNTNSNEILCDLTMNHQTAIIAKIVGPKGKVITTEVVPELISFAKENLKKAKIDNVEIFEEDGSKGIKSKGMFDKIIITAACREFPKPLLDQLKPNGIIVGPIGSRDAQEMVRGIKDKKGKLQLEFLGSFLFTPMYGKYGFED